MAVRVLPCCGCVVDDRTTTTSPSPTTTADDLALTGSLSNGDGWTPLMVFLVVVVVMCCAVLVVFSVLLLLRLIRCCTRMKNRHRGVGKSDGQLQFLRSFYTKKRE